MSRFLLFLLLLVVFCEHYVSVAAYSQPVCQSRTGPKPFFTAVSSWKIATVGEDVRLYCNAIGLPTPMIFWMEGEIGSHQHGMVNRISTPHSISENGRLLTLHKVQKFNKEEDYLSFTCQASNPFGVTKTILRVVIRKPVLPKIIYPTSRKIVRVFGGIGFRLGLQCMVVGRPKPKITWMFKPNFGKPTAISRHDFRFHIQPLSLIIKNLTPFLAGKYFCIANCMAGNDRATFEVKVDKRKPPALSRPIMEELKSGLENLAEKISSVPLAVPKTRFDSFKSPFPLGVSPIALRAEKYDSLNMFLQRVLKRVRHAQMSGKSILPVDLHVIKEVERLSDCPGEKKESVDCRSDLAFHMQYSSIDGTCNNFAQPELGAARTTYKRLLEPLYEDGLCLPVGYDPEMLYFGFKKPSPRKVSLIVMDTDRRSISLRYSNIFNEFGQFLDHDFNNTPNSPMAQGMKSMTECSSKDICSTPKDLPCFAIHMGYKPGSADPRKCMPFTRSSAACEPRSKGDNIYLPRPRQQLNTITHYIDASNIYGSNQEVSDKLRDLKSPAGLMKTSFDNKLPTAVQTDGVPVASCRDNANCFAAGDNRVNEQPGLQCQHQLFLREHNRIARKLKKINSHWPGQKVWLETRKIVIGTMHNIVYGEYLDILLGSEKSRLLGKYKGYQPDVDPRMANVFATAAFRYGHTHITGELKRISDEMEPLYPHMKLAHHFFDPYFLRKNGGCDPLLRGFALDGLNAPDSCQGMDSSVREDLFIKKAEKFGLDLSSINMQRGRDHGLPGYNDWRVFCGLSYAQTFDDVKTEILDPITREKLKEVYGSPGNCDIWTCGALETAAYGGVVGPTFACLLSDQFRRSRDGDRFFYLNPGVFTPKQLHEIRKTSYAKILCDNGDHIQRMQPKAFTLPVSMCQLEDCNVLPPMNLEAWREVPAPAKPVYW